MFERMIISKLEEIVSNLKGINSNIVDKRKIINELESIKDKYDKATKNFR